MHSKELNKLIVIVGPTAVGKTALTVQLAKIFNTSVINADSRQVYSELNIGTAKPNKNEMQNIQHYFVGDRDLEHDYSAGIFERETLELLDNIFKKTRLAMMSGGSGLYIKAVCQGFDEIPAVNKNIRMALRNELEKEGLEKLLKELEQKDPAFMNEVDTSNPQRIIRALEVIRTSGKPFSSFRILTPAVRSFSTIKIGLDRPREELYDRINSRVDNMIEMGLISEVKGLQKYRDRQALNTVGYQEIFGYLDGDYDLSEAIRLLKRNSRRYAKRQLTWFKADPEIMWFNPDNLDSITAYIQQKI